jgi:hypothetical protein
MSQTASKTVHNQIVARALEYVYLQSTRKTQLAYLVLCELRNEFGPENTSYAIQMAEHLSSPKRVIH